MANNFYKIGKIDKKFKKFTCKDQQSCNTYNYFNIDKVIQLDFF